MDEWKHGHTDNCRWEPELGWACHYSREEREIWRLTEALEKIRDRHDTGPESADAAALAQIAAVALGEDPNARP